MFISNLVAVVMGVVFGVVFGAWRADGHDDGGMGGMMGGIWSYARCDDQRFAYAVWVTAVLMVALFLLSMVALVRLVQTGAARQYALDPVCGMAVDTATAKLTSDYRGNTIYFCAPAEARVRQSAGKVYRDRKSLSWEKRHGRQNREQVIRRLRSIEGHVKASKRWSKRISTALT